MICPWCRCRFCVDDDIFPGEPNPRVYCSKVCSKKAQRARGRLREEMAAVVCTGEKKAYWDASSAMTAAKRIYASMGHNLFPYGCGDHWHLSSHPSGWTQRKLERVGMWDALDWDAGVGHRRDADADRTVGGVH